MIDDIREYLELFKLLRATVESDVDWQIKYSLVFHPKMSHRMQALYRVEYYDPDMGYEDDVMAFYDAVKDKARGLEVILANFDKGQQVELW
jgi:hypothetical protein